MNKDLADIDETLKIVFLGDSGISDLSRRRQDDYPE